MGAKVAPPPPEVAAGLLEPGRLGRLGGEQEPGQGTALGQVGGPQLVGGAGPGGVGTGDVPGDAGEVAGEVALDHADRHQGDHEHPDQQGEVGLDRHPHVQLPARTDSLEQRSCSQGRLRAAPGGQAIAVIPDT